MRILVVGLATFEQMAGGSARYISGVSNGFRRLGHSVEVHTAAEHVTTTGHTQGGFGGQLRRMLARVLVTMPRAFVAVLRFRPDVVNVHFALDGLPAVVAARLRRVPVVVNFQGPWALEAMATGRRGSWPLSTRTRHAIEGFVYRRARRCIVLSSSFGELLAEGYGVRPTRIRVIPAGIDTARFRGLPEAPEARRQLGIPEGFTVVTVRRLVPRMGLGLAIEAVQRLSPGISANLVIAGTGPEREALEALARRLDVERRIHFLGRVPDEALPILYAAGDVCVVPSRSLEGFGYVALESLAAGTPVIATGVGGLRELVGALERRWVVEPDPTEIADAIARLAADRSAYPDRQKCIAYASAMDWSVILPRVLAVISEAVDESHSEPRRRHPARTC